MSTKYLLTLMADKITSFEKMLNKLKEQDGECVVWKDNAIANLEGNLFWLKSKVQQRREEVIKADGLNPAEYSL